MSLSYRKSVSAGPFRINFSKSGVSYSVGVKGARVNMGPRGTYVNLSSNGISYRKKIGGTPAANRHVLLPATREVINNITSAQVEQLTDTDSKSFITELTEKSLQASYVKRWGIFPLIVLLCILIISSFSQEQTIVPSAYGGQITENALRMTNPYLLYQLAICLFCFIPLIYWLTKVDKKRFEMALNYEMDEQYKQIYQQFSAHFISFSKSAKVWQYLNAQRTKDFKRNAGAGKLIKRIGVSGIAAHKVPLQHFITNVSIPYVLLNNMELYFLPERLLIKRGKTFAAVFYKNLRVTTNVTRFIEDGFVPHDASVIDYTWRYVNRKGGPDRRFNNNRKLPICAYSEYMFTSDTGIFEVISTSKTAAMDAFAGFLSKIGELQGKVANM